MPLAIFGIDDSGWNTVVVAGLTAFFTTLLTWPLREGIRLRVDARLHRRNADTDYEYEQRKRLREAIGAHHGALVQAADRFNHRLVNLRSHHDEPWLRIDGAYNPNPQEQYYFTTTVYRFMVLMGTADWFERQALVIDSRIADADDHAFLRYAKLLRWVVTDAELFAGTGYDASTDTDHFFTDRLREMSACALRDGTDPGLRAFSRMLHDEPVFVPVIGYFDGLSFGELRCDRLMALQLVLLSFLNRFGDEIQSSPPDWFDTTAAAISHDEVARNLLAWLPRFGLEGGHIGVVGRALTARLASTAGPPAGP